jgi:hypothetical protein
MTERVANKSKRLIFVGGVIGANILLPLIAINVFPDQTWIALDTTKTLYAEMVSRLIPVPTGADRITEEERIHEAVLRYMIPTVRIPVYISIEGKDPTDEFMARLADLNPVVKRVSEAEPLLRGWVDRSTGEHGVMLSVSSIKWSFGDRVEVDGGFYCGHLCGSGGVYEVMKSRGHWKVESYRKRWDS